MRRLLITIAAVPMLAGAGAAQATFAGPAERPPVAWPARVEPLRLGCGSATAPTRPDPYADPRTDPRQATVGCTWSPARHPAFAAYRLWRGGPDRRPSVVFTTTDRRHTSYVDTDVRAGAPYMYLVDAVDAGRQVVARSNPVRVIAGR